MPNANTITVYNTFTAGTKARSAEVNTNFSNHRGHQLPINTDTASSSDNEHNLGSSDHRFARAYVNVGSYSQGDTKMFHSFNGALAIGAGWMQCDGRQITETNYNTEHGAGSWADDINTAGSLLNLFLPNMTNKYAVGAASTTEGGTVTAASVGNTSSVISISHSHSHNHQWYNEQAGTDDNTYNSGGGADTLTSSALADKAILISDSGQGLNVDSYTNNDSTNALSSSQNIQPESIEFLYYMRII